MMETLARIMAAFNKYGAVTVSLWRFVECCAVVDTYCSSEVCSRELALLYIEFCCTTKIQDSLGEFLWQFELVNL